MCNQPVAVGVEVQSSFQLYAGGVYGGTLGCGARLNHALLVVGFGTDPDTGLDYW